MANRLTPINLNDSADIRVVNDNFLLTEQMIDNTDTEILRLQQYKQDKLTPGNNINIDENNVISAAGGSNVNWGNITGNIENQMDLRNKLNSINAKLAGKYDIKDSFDDLYWTPTFEFTNILWKRANGGSFIITPRVLTKVAYALAVTDDPTDIEGTYFEGELSDRDFCRANIKIYYATDTNEYYRRLKNSSSTWRLIEAEVNITSTRPTIDSNIGYYKVTDGVATSFWIVDYEDYQEEEIETVTYGESPAISTDYCLSGQSIPSVRIKRQEDGKDVYSFERFRINISPYNIATKAQLNTKLDKTTDIQALEKVNTLPTSPDANTLYVVPGSSGGSLCVNILYNDLKTLRDNGNLIPGQQYRIIDYQTIINGDVTYNGVTKTLYRSAGHQFDIIVTADSENTLNENARAALHDGDTYFANCDLNAWKIKYSLDNTQDLQHGFEWANITNGKGVIWYMEDEHSNIFSFDFKNIQMKRMKITANTNNVMVGDYKGCYRGIDTKTALYPATATIDENDYVWVYTFNISIDNYATCQDLSINNEGNSNGWTRNNHHNVKLWELPNITHQAISTTGAYIRENTYQKNCHCVATGAEFWQNSSVSIFLFIGGGAQSNVFGEGSSNIQSKSGMRYNHFGCASSNIIMGSDNYGNSFGSRCSGITIGDNCNDNSFSENCSSITFGNNCYSNSFGNGCYNNSFKSNVYLNTFSDGCSNFTDNRSTDTNSIRYCNFGTSTSVITFNGTIGYEGIRTSAIAYNITFNGNNQYIEISSGSNNLTFNDGANRIKVIATKTNVTYTSSNTGQVITS